ncbi:MAG: flagellar hook capping FlgD N-terminal domain-containing protein [Pseudomonadota bacterium]
MTAQVQNQDPLSPLDSTQFVEQLATFSALEQQVQTNTHLQSIADLVRSLNGATDGA